MTADPDATPEEDREPHPRGTLLLGLIFLVLLAGAWLLMYFTLLSRG
jgi:hypothetical protein